MDQRTNARTDSATLLDEPQHWLYAGVTMTGKTTLARLHARKLAKAKHRVIVYDPVGTETAGGGWEGCTVLPDDPEKAIRAIEKSSDAFVFVDEAPDVFGHMNRENHWLLRKGRHAGLYFRLITQRPTMLPPNVRTQCARVFLFRLSTTDSKVLALDMGHEPDVIPDLDTGDCLMLQAGSTEIEEFNCFDLVGSKSQSTAKRPER